MFRGSLWPNHILSNRTKEFFPSWIHFRNNTFYFLKYSLLYCPELNFEKLHVASEEAERCNIYSKWQYVQLKWDILLPKEEWIQSEVTQIVVCKYYAVNIKSRTLSGAICFSLTLFWQYNLFSTTQSLAFAWVPLSFWLLVVNIYSSFIF